MAKVAVIIGLALLVGGNAHALHKCTDASGKVTFQDAPCAAGATTAAKIDAKPNTNVMQSGRRMVQPNAKADAPTEAAALMDIYRRWIDAERLAGATGRIALATPVASLQALQREAESTRVAECVVYAKASLTKLIATSVDAHISFMHKNEAAGMVYQFLDREKLIVAFEQELGAARCKS
jgi:hypothetical protein